MRKTIYVSSEEQWLGVQGRAKEAGMSVSQYLLGGEFYEKGGVLDLKSSSGAPFLKYSSEQMDRIESKLDKLLSGAVQVSYTDGSSGTNKISAEDEAMLRRSQAAGQAKLDAERRVKKEKIEKVMGVIDKAREKARIGGVSMTDVPFVNYSKSKQLGKKGAK